MLLLGYKFFQIIRVQLTYISLLEYDEVALIQIKSVVYGTVEIKVISDQLHNAAFLTHNLHMEGYVLTCEGYILNEIDKFSWWFVSYQNDATWR